MQLSTEDTKTLVEIYKLYVRTSESTSDRRGRTNSFYLVLCSTLLTVFGTLIGTLIKLKIIIGMYSLLLLGLLGLLLSIVWFINIKSYRQLNTGKFAVISELEKKLPFPCFTKEWEELGHRGNKKKRYFKLTIIEQYVPLIFTVGFIILLIYQFMFMYHNNLL